jgi:hypothetical protein
MRGTENVFRFFMRLAWKLTMAIDAMSFCLMSTCLVEIKRRANNTFSMQTQMVWIRRTGCLRRIDYKGKLHILASRLAQKMLLSFGTLIALPFLACILLILSKS